MPPTKKHRTRTSHQGTAQGHRTRVLHKGTAKGHCTRTPHKGTAKGHRTRAPHKGTTQGQQTIQTHRTSVPQKGTAQRGVSQKGTAPGYRTKRQHTKVWILHSGIARQKYHTPPHRGAPHIINRRNVLGPCVRRNCLPGKQCQRRNHLLGVTSLSHVATSGNSKR